MSDALDAAVKAMPEASVAPPAPLAVDADTAAVHFKISHAFKIFDQDNSNQVDAREIGTIVRSLGVCPSEADLRDILLECDEEESTGFIKYSRFEPVMTRVLKQKKFKCAPESVIMQAFQVLDPEKLGFLKPDDLKKLLMSEGEPFTEEEVEEMLAAAVEPEKKVIFYDDHVNLLLVEEPS